MSELSRVDLNLLTAFKVLVEQRHVTRAAQQLFITQSAMSKTLGRLRVMFNDPLLTKTPGGMVLTPKAESLYRELTPILSQIEGALFEKDFDIRAEKGTVCIAIPEIGGLDIIAELIDHVSEAAPQLRLEIINSLGSKLDLEDLIQQQRHGKVDFFVTHRPLHSKETTTTLLRNQSFFFWVRKNHPLTRKRKISLKDFYGFPHIMLIVPGVEDQMLDYINEELAGSDLQCDVAFKTTSFFLGCEVLLRSDAIMIAAEQAEASCVSRGEIISKSLPKGLPRLDNMNTSLYLTQHNRTTYSAVHQWVSKCIIDICNSRYHP